MGRYVKKRDDTTSMYYWYPGEKVDWVQAGMAAGSGLLAAAVIRVVTGSWMWGSAVGFTVAAALAGLYLGRRDARALAVKEFSRFGGIIHVGMAFVRALAKGCGAALAAMVVAKLATGGFWMHWVLPLVPAVVGAVAHHLGMFYEQMEKVSKVPVKASESALAKAVAEGRLKAAAKVPAAKPEAEAKVEPEAKPEPVGAAVDQVAAAALPGEVDDESSGWEVFPADAARIRGRAPGSRRAVFSKRRPGVREVV
jgi:hypothetical protein